MRFQPGQQALLIDAQGLPAFTVKVTGYNPSNSLYLIEYKYPGSEKTERQEVPEHRLRLVTDAIQ